MKKWIVATSTTLLLGSIGLIGTALAHHSFSMYERTEQILIEGRVTDWNYNSPHSWLYIEAVNEAGETQTWSLEGAAPIHAARQGVTGNTYIKGELVRAVMSPIKDNRPAGALCFVMKENGEFTRPNDGNCNSNTMYETWETMGWLENGSHLDTHPFME
jgi:hypothetical protein